MRVIAGIYKGRVLKGPRGLKTRPTSDRLRETLFNILNPHISSADNFLDLCAGSGAVGIEALSRGVQSVTFVEKSRKMCGLIEENLDLLGIPEDESEVICESAEKFLAKDASRWDLVYFDPPYDNDYAEVLKLFGNSQKLADDGLLIAEHRDKTLMPEEIGDLRRWRLLRQGDSCLSFYQR